MKIKYTHIDNPNVEKIYDTVKSYTNPNNGPRVFDTQEEFDAFELEHFAKDKEQGTIISYEIIAEAKKGRN